MFGRRPLIGRHMRQEEDEDERDEVEADADRLEEIKYKILELLEECDGILREYRKHGALYDRAERYWMAHIEGALIHGGRWLGGSMHRMEDTIKELRELENEEKEE